MTWIKRVEWSQHGPLGGNQKGVHRCWDSLSTRVTDPADYRNTR